MKILQINKYYYLKSGSERYLFNVSSLLKEHGHQVIPFAMKHENSELTDYSKYFIENIDYEKLIKKNILEKIYVGFKTIYSLEARDKLLKLIEKEDPDIAHVHKLSNTLTPSVLYALKKKDIPIVQTLHDYRIVCPSYNLYDPNKFEICEDCRRHRYFNAAKRKCQKSSHLISLNVAIESYLYHFLNTYESTIDLFISPSCFLMKKVVEFGISPENIVWIPHFIRSVQYIPNYNASDYILYFGRLEKHKGIKTLIDAMKNINYLRLYVVGKGTFQVEIEKYAKKNDVKNVTFLGYKPENELIDLVRKSLFTVVPSEWYEPFGFTVLESFALGKPVVGANIGGIPELVESKHTGMLFRSGDADDLAEKISYLSNKKDLVVEMGRNARKKVEEEYNEDLHYQKLIEAYKTALDKHIQN